MSDATVGQGMDFPDSAGWWAYKNGETCFVAEFILFHPLGEWTLRFLRWRTGLDEQSMRGHEFKIKYPGKWYRLHMPWDTPAAAQGASVPSVATIVDELERLCLAKIDEINNENNIHTIMYHAALTWLAQQRGQGGEK